MFFLKWLLVLALLATGACFLATGLGVTIPLVQYKGMEAHGVPIGAVLLVVGVALAALWKISTTTTTERTEEIIYTRNSDDGSSSSSKSSTKTTETTQFKPPQ